MSRRILRPLAIALALVAVCGQFFSISHLLLVPHTVCAEHGELIHLDASDTARGHAHAQATHYGHAARDSARSWYRADAEAGASDSHDHCLISALRRETLAISAPASVRLPIPQPIAVSTFEHDIATPRTFAILHFAPKSSPPPRA